jgi:single-stranded-DNA-specific exonuclease
VSTSNGRPKARWILPAVPESEAQALASACSLALPAARVLCARGFRDSVSVRRFLSPDLSDLEDPALMLGMDRAVDRVFRAIRDREKILLYGDYDTDGVTSVTLLRRMIELLGHAVDFHIPDRFRDGYGMQPAVVEEAARSGVRLIISVDTGIRAAECVRVARDLGIDTIITDHHLPEAELPPAYAILNPNQPGCPYPNKNLCGAGVTFKLLQALMAAAELPAAKVQAWSDSFLSLVAMATVADVVPLTFENRILVQRGIDSLRQTRNPGLRALMECSGLVPGEPLSCGDLGFRLSPRINAAGRMDNARDVVELFLTKDPQRAAQIAAELDRLNAERRAAEEKIVKNILEACEREPVSDDQRALVFSGANWHRGVVGIVASRIVERYHRPVLVLSEDPETGFAQGSGRSIEGFHLLEALESMSEIFLRFGGHKHAAGLTLSLDRLPELRDRFSRHAFDRLQPEDLVPTLTADAITACEEITDSSVDQVLQLAPFGLGNPRPRFLLQGVTVAGTPAVFKEKLVIAKLSSPGGVLKVKAWNFTGRLSELAPGARVDAIVSLEDDAYSRARGYAPWSALLEDVRPAQE